jgi:hypothetical protein
MRPFKSFLEARSPLVKTDVDDLHKELASHDFAQRNSSSEKAKEYHRTQALKVLEKMKKRIGMK